MKNIIISVLVVLLIGSIYMNFKSKKEMSTYVFPGTNQASNTEPVKSEDTTEQIKTQQNNDKKPASPIVTLVAKIDRSNGILLGSNAQVYDLTINSDTNLGNSKLIITYSTTVTYPGAQPNTGNTEKILIVNKGQTIVKGLALGIITKITINGINVPFTQERL